jgi:hypothetical protein
MATTPARPNLHVTTEHSDYLFDQNRKTYVRTRVSEQAANLTLGGVQDGETLNYIDLSPVVVGHPLRVLSSHGIRHSTNVTAVEEVPAK